MDYDVNDTSRGLKREHEALTWLRANDPVHWDPKNRAWLLTRHAQIREVLNRPGIWSSAHGYFPAPHMSDAKNSLITMDDPEHARHRLILARAFTPRMLERQASHALAFMDDAIDAIADRRECNLVESLATPLPMRMIAGMVGFEDADADEFRALSEALFEFSSATPGDSAPFERGIEAASKLAEHVRRAVAERHRKPRGDLLSVLVESVDAGELRTDDVIEYAILLVSAGNETTRHTISWGMQALLERPEQLALLRREPERVPVVLEEWLRWASVVRGLKRTALEDTEVLHQKIRSGDQVILLFPSANRDADVFERPFEFQIAREPNRHLAFSHGAHFCLGANLARLEMRIALQQMLKRLPGLRLAEGAQVVPKLTGLSNGVEKLDVAYDAVARRVT